MSRLIIERSVLELLLPSPVAAGPVGFAAILGCRPATSDWQPNLQPLHQFEWNRQPGWTIEDLHHSSAIKWNSLYRALVPLDSCRVLPGQAVDLVTYPILFGQHKIHCPQKLLFGIGLLASEVVEFAVGFLPRTGLYYFLAHQWSNFGWPPNSPLSQWQKDEWAVWIL